MTISELLALRLYNQRLLHSEFTTPDQVVKWFGAIQAQEMPISFYAFGLRIPGSTEVAIEQATTDKTIVRTWPMRSTLHFVPADDTLWMTRLLGPRQNRKTASIYRNLGITEGQLSKARSVLENSLSETPTPRQQVYELLESHGIDTKGSKGAHLMRYWAQEGLLCQGPRSGKQQTFVLLRAWIPDAEQPSTEEALALLARRYFQSHGPATIQDFMWWSGLTKTEAQQGIGAIKNDFTSEDIAGKNYIFYPLVAPKTQLQHPPLLLPPFDEYTVAYADRSAVMGTADMKAVGYGIDPNIIINGQSVGRWKRVTKGRGVAVQLSPFQELSPATHAAITAAAQRYAAFIGTDVSVF
ncbi:MAG TPA: winged helix DNA-binding domain-containing protein [Verrucomicrobiae bacterium]|nr:winged helix DNA-binding domain-containing protein [Verrucomicrobiae bacterium]